MVKEITYKAYQKGKGMVAMSGHYLDSDLFSYRGREFQVVGSESTGRGIDDVVHTVVRLPKRRWKKRREGKLLGHGTFYARRRKLTMQRLVELLKKKR